MATLYETLASQRADVPKVYGRNVDAWWNQWGDREFTEALQALGRTDVLQAMKTPEQRKYWYLNHGIKEYGNIWNDAAARKNQTAQSAVAEQPKSLAQKYAESVLPKGGVQSMTAFSKVLPRETLVNQDLINQFAFSQVNPEYDRLKSIGMKDLGVQQNLSGQFRFGTAKTEQQRLADQYERARKEAAQPFATEATNRLGDYYNTLYEEYAKDPNAFQYKPLDVNQYLAGGATANNAFSNPIRTT